MTWLRFLAATHPPDHPLRNAILLEIYAQMNNDALSSPFDGPAPGGSLRDVDWRQHKTLEEVAERLRRVGTPARPGGVGKEECKVRQLKTQFVQDSNPMLFTNQYVSWALRSEFRATVTQK